MQILGVEREHLLCPNCEETMVITERRPHLRCGAVYELQLFECYTCRQGTRILVAVGAEPEVSVNAGE